jgi:beta-N-acetylhexosaminidase
MTCSALKRKKIFSASLYIFTIYFFTLSHCYALPNSDSYKRVSNQNVTNNAMTREFQSTKMLSDFERLVATKMALDIRYFCSEENSDKSASKGQCLQPVTELPQALAEMVTHSGIGSVVLFAENLKTTEQIINLTHDLQQAAVKSKSGQPLIISVDQEGGRVVRLPHATSFAGNMAIGATYLEHGVTFASKTSQVIAKELSVLGINNNYGPVVDVNTNADNPVINTRSFGEDPQKVAELGVASVNAFQQNGIMATLKHFPGHGDTHVDSHLGLPLVDHDLDTITKQDLAPFHWAIKRSAPAMIMTAHIQYPALDNSQILNKAGESIVRPATMSRKILTDLLRGDMDFEGIIATDALDMAGIAHYFDEVTAVVETFVAGTDLAVMPFKIRKVEDIERFYQFIKDVAQKLQQKSQDNHSLLAELTQSIKRINHYKDQYCQPVKTSLSEQVSLAEQLIAKPESLALEQSLVDNAAVQLTTKNNSLPVNINEINRIHLFVLDWQEFGALKQAITNEWESLGKAAPQVSATVVSEGNTQRQLQSGEKLAKADLVIVTVDTKVANALSSVVDTGGVEDLLTKGIPAKNRHSEASYGQLLSYQLQQANKQNVPSVLIAKGSPYLLRPYFQLADSILVTFDDHIYQNRAGEPNEAQAFSTGYIASMSIISGQKKARGTLPVSLQH